jgi:hypothetical protein
MSKNYYKKNQQPDILQTIILGIFKLIWWLVTLPFKGVKFGKGKSGLTLDERAYVINKRTEIGKMLASQNQFELKHAVMEADKLVDYCLQIKGFAGTTFADKLRSSQQFISHDLYNQLWQGHKTRNQIAHEQNLQISDQELVSAAKKLLRYTEAL